MRYTSITRWLRLYIADKYKDVIPDKLYQAMISWEFDEYVA